MNYQLMIKNEFGSISTIPIEEVSDASAYEKALRIIEEQNNGSVAVKYAALHRLEHVWSASFKTDSDF